MPLPTQQQVHPIDYPLTNLTEMFRFQDGDCVADAVFPPIVVEHKSNVFFKYDRGDFFRDTMKETAPGALPEYDGYRLSTGTYSCKEYKLGHLIPDSVAANMDSALSDPAVAGTQLLVNKAKINREVNWVSSYFGTGLWGTDITGVASAPSGAQTLQWSVASSTPVEDVLTGKAAIKQSTGLEPNVLVLQYLVKKALLTNAEVLDRLKYGTTDRPVVTVEDSDLAKLFKVEKIVTAGAIKTTSKEGQTTTTDFIAGKNALLAYAAPAPGLMVASAGYTFNWKGPAGANGAGWTMKQWYDNDRSSRKLLLEQNYGFGLVSNILGYFFASIVA